MDLQVKNSIKTLILGSIGIYTTYCLASLLQQYIIKSTYLNWRTGAYDNLNSTTAFILIPSLVAWVLGIIANANNEKKIQIPNKNLLYCGMLTNLTTFAFTKAIYITNFPIVMMFKSCNVLSVIVVSVFFSRVKQKQQRLDKYQLITGLVVTIGLLLYYLGGSKQNFNLAFNPYGMGLLVFSLVCDGFLPDFQAQIKSKYKPTAMEMFEGINKWKLIVCVFYLLFAFQFIDLLIYFVEHPTYLFHLVALGMLGSLGQMIVFWFIKNYRQHVAPFIITTRKITTTLLSIIFFGHELFPLQLLGIIITYTLVIYDFYRQIKHQQKMKPRILTNQQKSFLVQDQDKQLMEIQILQKQNLLD